MSTHQISPKSWYILDLRDPKNPLVPTKKFLFKEWAVLAISRYFPNTSLVVPVLGEELIEYSISPKYGAYSRYRFTIKTFQLPEGTSRRSRTTFSKQERRRRRRAKFKEMTGYGADNPLYWGDILPKNLKDENGKKVTNRERYNIRARTLTQLYKKFDHL